MPAVFELRLGAFSSSVDSTVQRASEDGGPGDEVDVEDVLGVPDRDTTGQIEAIMRFGFYHRLEAGYFQFGRESQTVLDRDITLGGETFTAGTEVRTTQDSQTFQFIYGYSLLRDAQKEFGLSAGLHYTSSETSIVSLSTGQVVELETDVPLPTLGAFLGIALTDRWSLNGFVRLFALEFGSYEGSMTSASVRLEGLFGEHVTAGVGFNYFSTRLEGLDSGNRSLYNSTRYKPLLYLGTRF